MLGGGRAARLWAVGGLRCLCNSGGLQRPSHSCASRQWTCVVARRAFGVPSPSDLFTSPAGLLTLLYGRVASTTGRADDAPENDQQTRQRRSIVRNGCGKRCLAGHWRVRAGRRNASPTPSSVHKHDERHATNTAQPSGQHGAPDPMQDNASSSARAHLSLASGYSHFMNREVVALIILAFVFSAIWEAIHGRKAVLQQKMKDIFSTTLEVRSSREEFAMIMDWLGRQVKGRRLRNIALAPVSVLDEVDAQSVQRQRGGGDVLEDALSCDERDATRVSGRTAFVPGYGSHALKFGTTWLWITRREDASKRRGAAHSRVDREDDVLTITFWSRRRQVVQDFLDAVHVSWREHVENSVRVYLGDGYQWNLLTERACRPLTTLCLPAATKAVVSEVRAFLSLRQTYAALGIPWRRGYLFEGTPGTGKTSFALALASAVHLPVYVLNLHSDNMDDSTLLYAVSTLPPRVLLLIEDIENVLPRSMSRLAASPKHTPVSQAEEGVRALNEGRISMSALLNALDGVTSSEGRVLVITTNDASRIPNTSALLRPGRIDRRIHFAPLRPDECREMQRMFVTELRASSDLSSSTRQVLMSAFSQSAVRDVVSPATLQQTLLDRVYAAMSTTAEQTSQTEVTPAT